MVIYKLPKHPFLMLLHRAISSIGTKVENVRLSEGGELF